MADFRGRHRINTSQPQETEKDRLEREEKARLERQDLERESVKEQILEVCKTLCLDDTQDVADSPAIRDLCQLLKQLAAISELNLDNDTADVPEDFSCLLKLLKAHRYGYCNITTCCEILNRLLEVSGSPYSTQTQAEVLKELSELWLTKASYDKAITTAEELAKLARELGEKKLEAEAYYIIVKSYILKGSLEVAKLTLQKCVQCSEESRDELTIGYSKFATATIYYLEQQYDKALEEDEKFLEIAKRLNNKFAQCEAILNMGTIYCTLFKIQTSLNLFSEGLKMAQELGHRKKVLETQANQASVFSVMGDYRKSYKTGSKMVESLHKHEDKAFVFTVLCNVSVDALLLNEDDKDEESLRLAKESLVIAEELDAGKPIALAHGNIGLAQEKLRDYPGAIESFKMCLEYGEKIKDTRIINNALCNLGRAYEGNGEKETARQYYLKALDMPEPPSSHWCDTKDFRFSPDYLLGKMAVEEEDFATARKYFQQVVERCEKFRKSVHDSPMKICFNDTQTKPFQYLQYVLLKDKAHAAALLVGEMGRGRDFYDKVIKEDQSKQLSTPEALINLAKSKNQAVLFLSKLDVVQEMRIWFIAPDGKITSLGQPLEQWEAILKDLRTYFSQKLIGKVQQSPQSTVQITADGAVIPSNAEGATEFRGVANEESEDESDDEEDDKKGVHAIPPGASTHPSSNSPSDNSRSMGGHTAPDIPEFSDLIDQVSELIVRPIEGDLVSLASKNGPKPQLLIIPQGDTFNIPYSTLRLENGEPLCSLVSPREAFSFHSYSYSTTLQEEAKSQPVHMEDILIVGNPTNDLKFSQKESEAIATRLGVTPLTNESATRSEVLRRLTKAPVIHFACHGTVDGRKLNLARERGNNNAKIPTYLTVEDISNMSLQAKLVVLSACHTGRGKISSEGVLGLARAFLMAGAKSVVTALWAVNDKATEKFMLKFYDNLYSEPVVNALASTMCEMKREKFKVTQWGSFKVLGANVEVFSSVGDV